MAGKPKSAQYISGSAGKKSQLIKSWNIYLPSSVINHGKKLMLNSKEQLISYAKISGYKPEIIERVYRLLDVFQRITHNIIFSTDQL